MTEQFAQEQTDLLLPNVVVKEQIVKIQPVAAGAQRNAGDDADLVPPPLAMAMNGSMPRSASRWG